MRDEDEVQEMADKASSMINRGRIDHMDKATIIVDERPYEVERLRGILDALDWVLDEDMEDAPL